MKLFMLLMTQGAIIVLVYAWYESTFPGERLGSGPLILGVMLAQILTTAPLYIADWLRARRRWRLSRP